MDTSVFNFNPTTRVFSVFTSNIGKIGLYTIKITGYIFDPNKKASISFNVDIRDNCENVVLTKSADQTINYREKDPALLINGFTFSRNIGTCGSFTYTCTDNLGNPIDTSIFTFNSATPSITVQTNLVSHVNTYNLKVIGTLGTWGSAEILVQVNI